MLRLQMRRASGLTKAMPKPASRLQGLLGCARDDKAKILTVEWIDGRKARFPYVWLRDNCPEPHTFSLTEASRSRLLRMQDLDTEIVPDTATHDESAVYLTWPDALGTPSKYESKWLLDRDFNRKEVVEDRKRIHFTNKTRWNRAKFMNRFKFHDFQQLLTDELYLESVLSEFADWGLVFLNNAAPERGQLARLYDLFGYSTSTHYGHIQEVKIKLNPSNIAYMAGDLELHTDLLSCRSSPQIQCLHFITDASVGGDSTFSDGLNAAGHMKAEMPDYYRLLSTIPVEYVDHGIDNRPFFLAARYPVFALNIYGELESVIFANFRRSWFWPGVEAEQVVEMYRALKYFQTFVEAPENRVQIHLQPGQMAIFDNLRVLHGRTDFTPKKDTERLLEIMYFPYDAFLSRIRYLRYKHDLPKKIESY